MDLWIMLRDKIEWKCFMKTPPVYVGPTSCHDPVVKKAVFKGVGHRLRLNSSKDELFDEAVDTCSKSFAIVGYNFQHARTELRKFRNENPNLIPTPQASISISRRVAPVTLGRERTTSDLH